jgi:hypothetical protein
MADWAAWAAGLHDCVLVRLLGLGSGELLRLLL